jgi:dihydrofolate reductase
MNLSIIVAMSKNGVIGRNGDLPWYLSADLKHFKAITMGKPIVMGRKTHESIGKPLPGRENIILTRNKDYQAEGCTVINKLNDLDTKFPAYDELMIIGGAQLYDDALPLARKLFITEVHAEVEGDTYFPEFAREQWQEIDRQDFKADEKNDFDYSFVVLKRV